LDAEKDKDYFDKSKHLSNLEEVLDEDTILSVDYNNTYEDELDLISSELNEISDDDTIEECESDE